MPIQDVISELNRIKAEGLISAYAVGGAVAAHAYIEPSETEDLDVFVVVAGPEGSSLNPLTRIAADLVSHGAIWDGPYLVFGGWPVQFLLPGTPLYDEAIADARPKDFGGGVIGSIMGPEHLAAIALLTHRGKDYLRVDEFIRRGKVDLPILMGMIHRYGLTEFWNKFRTIFPVDNV